MSTWILLLLPLIIIQLGLLLFAVIDLAKKKKTKNLSPTAWILIICLVNTIGPVLYLILGRADESDPDNSGEETDYENY